MKSERSITEINSLLTKLFRTRMEEKKYRNITRQIFMEIHNSTTLEVCVDFEMFLSLEVLFKCSQPE